MSELATALQAESAAVRWQAIARFVNAAGADKIDTATISVLVNALADAHPFVRWQAGVALARQNEGRQRLIGLLKGETLLPVDIMPSQGEESHKLMQAAAIDGLANQKSPEVSQLLIGFLDNDDARLRQSAAEALAYQNDPNATPHLIAALKDVEPWVRRAAVYALGCLGNRNAAATLIDGLRDEMVLVRRSAAYALGALRAEIALPQLKVALSDQDPHVRRNAAWALGRIGSAEAVPELKQLLEDRALDGSLVTTASQAIEMITRPRWLQMLVGARSRLHQ